MAGRVLLNFKELKRKGVPYGREHLRTKIKEGTFPAPVPISDRAIGWIESEIDDWVEQRIALRDQQKQTAA
jgi:prophage regulatory protein